MANDPKTEPAQTPAQPNTAAPIPQQPAVTRPEPSAPREFKGDDHLIKKK